MQEGGEERDGRCTPAVVNYRGGGVREWGEERDGRCTPAVVNYRGGGVQEGGGGDERERYIYIYIYVYNIYIYVLYSPTFPPYPLPAHLPLYNTPHRVCTTVLGRS